MNGRIYKIINDVNSKIYVGQTRQSLIDRLDLHIRNSNSKNYRNMPILYAIRKYGVSHFKIELLEELSELFTQEEIDNKEIEWGLKLNTLSPNGYNLRLGKGKSVVSEETRKKIGDIHRGKKLPEWHKQILLKALTGRVRPQEEKDKISENNARYWKGKKRSDEDKKKMSKPKTFKNGIPPSSIPIIASCEGNVYEFNSFADASRSNIFDKSPSATAICRCCKGKQISCSKINGKKVYWKYKNL